MTERYLSSRSSPPSRDPDRDWGLLIVAALFVTLVTFGASAALYLHVKDGTAVLSQGKTVPVPSVETFDAAQKVFGARATEETNYQTTYHFVDPSGK